MAGFSSDWAAAIELRGLPEVVDCSLQMPGAVTGLVAIGLQEFVDFSLQIPGNAVLFTVLAAIAIHRPAARSSGPTA